MPSYDPNLKWPEGTKFPKVYDPALDGDPLSQPRPKWRWEPKLGLPGDKVEKIAYWREQAEYWKDRYTKALKAYENLFPTGETAGRIVMLYWDGKTWIRLPEGPGTMAEQERLAKQVAYDKEVNRLAYEEIARMTEIKVKVRDNLTDLLRAEKTFQIGVEVPIEPEPPKPKVVERTRRNNVVE